MKTRAPRIPVQTSNRARARSWGIAALLSAVACGGAADSGEKTGSASSAVVELKGRPLAWPGVHTVPGGFDPRLPGRGGVGADGQFQYELPIDVPPGRDGMAPSLALHYSSGAGNGALGVGWSLSGLSSI